MRHTFTFTFDAPEEAAGAVQVDYARLAAVQLLEQLEKHWPGFRRTCARHDDGRFWLYLRRDGRPLLDKLVVVATECRANTHRDQIVELQRALRQIVVSFDEQYPGLYRRLSDMMRQGGPLGLLLRRLLGGRPVDGAGFREAARKASARK